MNIFGGNSPSGDPDERLARIETKIDMILTMNADHESRLRIIEGKQGDLERQAQAPLRAYAVPIAMVTAIASVVVSIWAMAVQH
jgi:hypothetical protein